MNTKDKEFSKLFIVTALPIILQNLLQNSLSFIDTLMIGQLGETAIASVGLGSQIFFLVTVVLFGISSGSSIFISQYWGKGDTNSIQKTVGLGLSAALIISGIFSCLSVFAPKFLLGFFVDDYSVIELGKIYLQYVGFSYLCTAVNMLLGCMLRSIGDTKTPMFITFISMITDVIGNYFLIFTFGLGVKGAAIATALSRLLETVLLVIVVVRKCPIKFKLSTMFDFDAFFAKKLFKTAFPVIADDGLWALGMTVYKMVHAHMGVDILASANVMGSIEDLFFVLQNGLGSATAILIGNEIGRGNIKRVKQESKLCMVYAVLGGIFAGLLMALSSSIIPPLFKLSENVNAITVKSMLIFSCLMPVKFMNHCNIVGLFRSGGDTKYVFWLEVISIWLVGVPLTYFSGLVWCWPIYYVYLMTNIEEVFKLVCCIPRLTSFKWINNLTENN